MKKKPQNYGVAEIVHTAEFYDPQNDFDFDVPFYLRQARRARGKVLELCCGSGRITLPLARAGIDITGVDISSSMLGGARRKMAQHGLKVPLIRADMRRLRLGKRFQLVFIPFNSLQNTYSLSDVEKVFAGVRAHLADGGRFIFDIFNPDIEYIIRMKKLQKSKYTFVTGDGKQVSVDEQCRYDSAGQVVRATWFYHINGGKTHPRQIDMRCFYPQEMEALLKYNGFKVLKKFGSFDGDSFCSESRKQIFICGKA